MPLISVFGADVENCSGIVLEKVAEYFYYNWRNRDAIDVTDMDVPPELCLELLMAADYLDSEMTCSSLKNTIADFSSSMTRIKIHDFTIRELWRTVG
jgi:hypothetical protein